MKLGHSEQRVQCSMSTRVGRGPEERWEDADADVAFDLLAYADHESSSHVFGVDRAAKKPGRKAGIQMAFLWCL